MRDNFRLLPLDFDDDGVPHSHAVSNDDPFSKPDYRAKRHARPVGRVIHKRRPRQEKASRVLAVLG